MIITGDPSADRPAARNDLPDLEEAVCWPTFHDITAVRFATLQV